MTDFAKVAEEFTKKLEQPLRNVDDMVLEFDFCVCDYRPRRKCIEHPLRDERKVEHDGVAIIVI